MRGCWIDKSGSKRSLRPLAELESCQRTVRRFFYHATENASNHAAYHYPEAFTIITGAEGSWLTHQTRLPIFHSDEASDTPMPHVAALFSWQAMVLRFSMLYSAIFRCASDPSVKCPSLSIALYHRVRRSLHSANGTGCASFTTFSSVRVRYSPVQRSGVTTYA